MEKCYINYKTERTLFSDRTNNMYSAVTTLQEFNDPRFKQTILS